jgi:LmbE family N-acetylglucosaminyl deacetylase
VSDTVLAISPHLDDAVFGCGDWLGAHPGAVVVTVLAGRPPAGTPLTPWDAAAGFAPGDDVVGERRGEDARALAVLGARPIWLDFLDAQYGEPPDGATLAAALEAVFKRVAPTTALVPLGLFHSDHALVHAAALDCARRERQARWLAYEEPTYRGLPEALAGRLDALRKAGVTVAPHPDGSESSADTKLQAIRCYASQLRALQTPGRPGWRAALEPERYWRIVV